MRGESKHVFDVQLDAVRKRLTLQLALRHFGVALLAGIAIFLCSTLFQIVWVGLLPFQGWVVALCAAIMVFAGQFAVFRSPSRADVAVWVDQHLSSQELFRSAEHVVSNGDARQSVVLNALLGQANAQSLRIVAPKLWDFDGRGALTTGIGALALLSALLTLLPPAKYPVSPMAELATSVAPDLSAGEQQALATDIQRLAEFMHKQAELRNDDYAIAIARTLEDLGARIEAGQVVAREDISSELASLRQYAVEATSQWRGSVGERLPELFEALAEQAALPKQMAMQSPSRSPADTSGSSDEDTASGGAERRSSSEAVSQSHPESSPDASAETPFSELMADVEAAVHPAASPAESGERAPTARVSSYLDVAKAQNDLELATAASEIGADAQLLGPSSDSRAGDSLLAGDGSSGLGNPESIDIALSFEPSVEVKLEAPDTGEGQRVEKDIAPPSQLSVVADPTNTAAREAWVRTKEAEVFRRIVAPENRERVSQYRLNLMAVTEP